MRLAVVGHVERAEILRVDRLSVPGSFVEASRRLVETAGAGAAAARQIAKLGIETTFFTALGDDEAAERARLDLVREGVRVHAVVRPGVAQRRAFVQVDLAGERAITVHGAKLCPSAEDPLPWAELASADGVCFVCGDEGALRAARAARILVATARWLLVLKRAGVHLDALVGSGDDPAEIYLPGDLEPRPTLLVRTAGASGGSYVAGAGPPVRYAPAPVSTEEPDGYGCGDSFVAGLTLALARGDAAAEAVAFAARCGAACFSSLGLSGQLRLSPEGDVRPPARSRRP